MTREESPFRSDGIPLGSEYRFSEISKAARALEDVLLLDLGPPFGPPFWGVRWDPQYPNPNTGKYRAEFPKDVIAVAIGDIPIEYSVTPIPPPYPDSNAK